MNKAELKEYWEYDLKIKELVSIASAIEEEENITLSECYS